MEIKPTGVPISAIVEIGNKARKAQQEAQQDCLLIHVGINNVVPININSLLPKIDFNSPLLQNYPGASGLPQLRAAINQNYFNNKASENHIFVTSGGMNGLYITLKTLNISTLYTPKFYWGTYRMLAHINKLQHACYNDFQHLLDMAKNSDHIAIIINDPGNPLGEKHSDSKLLEVINKLDLLGLPIILDIPYRRLFTGMNDLFYQRLLSFENVIIVDSFSKSYGLSGYRIGFIHSNHELFNREFGRNLLYCSNGQNVVGQEIIRLLLSTPEGQEISEQYRKETIKHIMENIRWLKEQQLIYEPIYKEAELWGIYSVINRSVEELEKYRIYGVPLSFFTLDTGYQNLSRICVSERHERFVSFFSQLSKQ
ncbi:MAG TPA: pyridoxal phosphate-dependent aminotransferase [Salinivirgaceae bacterium]|nr:pyridoxal phosphate-dependent aminotransferase [Salinivirgaceae bacterium]